MGAIRRRLWFRLRTADAIDWSFGALFFAIGAGLAALAHLWWG